MGGGRYCEAGMSMSLAALVFSMVSMFDRLRLQRGGDEEKKGRIIGGLLKKG